MAAFGVQLLKQGLALCGKNFTNFVEAWNHVVQRSANLCGDADANPADGRISVDNTNPDHPVIRFDATGLTGGSSGGDDSGDDDTDSDEAKCVTSANAAKGDVYVIGGGHIDVETNGQTIKISYNENKDGEDDDPQPGETDPCDHDGIGNEGGGVDASSASGDGGGSSDGGSPGGGVPADGDTHPGSGCNTCG